MLRTLSSALNDEPKLVHLCRNKKWIAVSLRSCSHPTEASPSEAAMLGEGSTVLGMAVRSGAPLSVLQALIKADVHQVGIVHGQRGSILHEAMKHRMSEDCLRFVLQSVIDYERSVLSSQQQQLRQLQYKSLLGCQDSMGRTALHFMVERALQELLTPTPPHRYDEHHQYNYHSTTPHHRQDHNDPMTNGFCKSHWTLFQSLVLAHPPAVHVMDCDGNTPLVLLLTATGRTHRPHSRRLFPAQQQQQQQGQHQQQHQRRALPARNTAARTIPDRIEAVIFHMIQLLVATCPSTAIISRRLPRPFRCCAQHNFSHSKLRYRDDGNNNKCHKQQHQLLQPLIGDGAPNPLSYALLYQRSMETIQLLLEANQKVGVRGCMTIVSHYHEVPLHIAATMRVPVPVLEQLVRHGPAAVLVPDAYGLMPLDWCWIRHVIDWVTPISERRNFLASRRRHIATLFPRWHEQATQKHDLASARHVSCCCWNNGLPSAHPSTSSSHPVASPFSSSVVEEYNNDHRHSLVPLTEFQLTCDLWHRIELLLPVVAHQQMVMSSQEQSQEGEGESDGSPRRVWNPFMEGNLEQPTSTLPNSSWSVLHAASFVSCPLTMVRMALEHSPHRWLTSRDANMGRLPLHYAASRVVGYTVQVPVGFTNEHLESIAEPSPVPDVISYWEQAARVTDGYGQLPLHIAIDAYKMERQRRQQHQKEHQEHFSRSNREDLEPNHDSLEMDDMVDLLLSYYPESLERRDASTKLFPFQQAAAGEGASLNTIFTLLQRQPTLVATQGYRPLVFAKKLDLLILRRSDIDY